MTPRGRLAVAASLAALVLAAAIGLAWTALQRVASPFSSASETTVRASGLPVVMRTPGGTLEVSTVKVY